MSDMRLGVVGLWLMVLLGAGCGFTALGGDSSEPNPNTGGTTGTPGTGNTAVPAGLGVGAPCAMDTQCRRGLSCAPATATCQPKGNSGPGAFCLLSAECLPDYHCAVGVSAQGLPETACAPRTGKAGGEGASCVTEGDCAPGFACQLEGLSGGCRAAGAGDVGAPCTGPVTCQAGLLCLASVCSTPLALRPWTGATCSQAEEPVAQVKFEIPRAATPAHQDFFALPFPNDARLKNGKLDMKNFPRPGAGALPYDPVAPYLAAIEADVDGASPNTTVFFRFSRWPNTARLSEPGVLSVVNLSPGPAFGTALGFGWDATTGGAGTGTGSRYICPRYLALRVSGRLEPGGTYGVLIKGPLSDKDNQAFVPASDFAALLADTSPVDPELGGPWARYAPLRTWIKDPRSGLQAAPLLGGTVFTVQNYEAPILGLHKAVAAAPSFGVKSMVKCGEALSPCDDGVTGPTKQRGCLAPQAAFDEYQGLVTMPVFQKGTRPYERPEQGGGIAYDAQGTAVVQGSEDVCVTVTVPKGPMPQAGWPVVVYAHGTGGNYLSGRSQWAQAFAEGTAGTGAAVPLAMISYDGALHATRKGVSTRNVDELVFNFLNPLSARDTALQGAADLFALARVAEAFSHGGVKFDASKLYLYGHSQGANAAATAAGYEARYKTVVLSGAGGLLSYSLTTKQKPVDIKAVLPVVLGDQVEYGSADPFKRPENHPLMAVLQLYFDRSDPANLARRIAAAPLAPLLPKHLLHVYGQGDTFAPEPTQQQLALAAGLPAVGAVVSDYPGLPKVPGPVKANLGGVTAGQRQFSPAGYDGHFVGAQNPAGRTAILEALVTSARDGVPTISP